MIALEAYDKGLLGTTLRYPYEVREAQDCFCDLTGCQHCAGMLTLAEHIPDSKAADFDLLSFRDRYEEALLAPPQGQADRRRSRAQETFAPPHRVINLMEVLRRSVAKDTQPAAPRKGAPSSPSAQTGVTVMPQCAATSPFAHSLDSTVDLVLDCAADLQTVVADLLSGQYRHPLRLVASTLPMAGRTMSPRKSRARFSAERLSRTLSCQLPCAIYRSERVGKSPNGFVGGPRVLPQRYGPSTTPVPEMICPLWGNGKPIMNEPVGKLARCAVYTRKSTEHNLDLAFASLYAQRAACVYKESRARGLAGDPRPLG